VPPKAAGTSSNVTTAWVEKNEARGHRVKALALDDTHSLDLEVDASDSAP